MNTKTKKPAKEIQTTKGLSLADLKKMVVKKGSLMTQADFDKLAGEGGTGNNVLKLDVGQAVAPVKFTGFKTLKLEDGDVESPHGDLDGVDRSLPLSKAFANQLEDLRVEPGDTLAICRLEDAIKKKGKGKGRPMQIYRIKVLARAA